MTDAREITVEEIDEWLLWLEHRGHYFTPEGERQFKALCALARRALSQEGGEQVRGCFCHTCGQIMPDTIVTPIPDTPQSVPACTCSKHPLWDGYDGDCPIHGWFEPVAPDTPQSVPAWELVPCMDAWCKISPCKCRDGINALIAERDKLKEEVERLTNTGVLARKELQIEDLVERVSVLEAALRDALDWINGLSDLVSPAAWKLIAKSPRLAALKAALRTSEDV
jgi:hypothetical protein